MSSYWKAFINPLEETLRRLISFVPRFLVAALLFLFLYGLAGLILRIIAGHWSGFPIFLRPFVF